jgi:hypothetical protein
VISSRQATTIAPKGELKPAAVSGLVLIRSGAVAIVSDAVQHVLFKVDIETGEWQHLSGMYMKSNREVRACNSNLGCDVSDFRDGSASEALFRAPAGLAYEERTNSVLVCDKENHALRRVHLGDGTTTTIAGRHDGCNDVCDILEGAYLEGVGRAAGFNRPSSVAVAPDGRMAVVADTYNNFVRLVNLQNGSTSLLVGSAASLAFPAAVILSQDGNMVYIADTMNNKIRSFRRDTSEMLTIAGPGFQNSPPGTDGAGTAATLSQPSSLSLISDGWLLISDTVSHTIRMLPLAYGAAYEAGKGFNICPACPAGTASKVAGAACDICPVDTYSSAASVSCLACPDSSTTLKRTGSTDISACECFDTLYPSTDAAGKLVCLKCPLAARCPEDGTCAFRKVQPSCGHGNETKPIIGSWVKRLGEMRLIDCPPGSLIVNASTESQTCLLCPPGKYSLNPLDNCGKEACVERECNQCPVGAQCNGGSHFQPLVLGSVWEQQATGAVTKNRLELCPSGHVLVRSPDRPENDECVKCPPNTYMVDQASYKDRKGVSPSAAVLQSGLDLCLSCPPGSVCGKEEVRVQISVNLHEP